MVSWAMTVLTFTMLLITAATNPLSSTYQDSGRVVVPDDQISLLQTVFLQNTRRGLGLQPDDDSQSSDDFASEIDSDEDLNDLLDDDTLSQMDLDSDEGNSPEEVDLDSDEGNSPEEVDLDSDESNSAEEVDLDSGMEDDADEDVETDPEVSDSDDEDDGDADVAQDEADLDGDEADLDSGEENFATEADMATMSSSARANMAAGSDAARANTYEHDYQDLQSTGERPPGPVRQQYPSGQAHLDSGGATATGINNRIMVLTFNAGEDHVAEGDLSASRSFLMGAMKTRILQAADPEIIMFASQGFNSGYSPLKAFMDSTGELNSYDYLGTVRQGPTAVEVAVKKGVSNQKHEESTQQLSLGGPGGAGMVRMKAEVNKMPFRFVGLKCEIGQAVDEMTQIGQWLSDDKHIVNIIAGTYNTPLKAGSGVTCEDKHSIKSVFKVPSSESDSEFLKASDTYDGLETLHSTSGLLVHMPFPPWAAHDGTQYFLPTYNFPNGCKSCDPSHIMKGEMEKLECQNNNDLLSIGFVDYFTVLYAGEAYKVSSGTLTWDGMPNSHHSMTTGVVQVNGDPQSSLFSTKSAKSTKIHEPAEEGEKKEEEEDPEEEEKEKDLDEEDAQAAEDAEDDADAGISHGVKEEHPHEKKEVRGAPEEEPRATGPPAAVPPAPASGLPPSAGSKKEAGEPDAAAALGSALGSAAEALGSAAAAQETPKKAKDGAETSADEVAAVPKTAKEKAKETEEADKAAAAMQQDADKQAAQEKKANKKAKKNHEASTNADSAAPSLPASGAAASAADAPKADAPADL